MRTTRWLWLTGALLGTGALVAGVHVPQAAGMPPAALAQGGTSAEANKAGTENTTAYPAQSGDPEPESLRTLALRHVLGIGMGQRLRIGKLSVYYLDPVTEQQALTVGDFLSRSDLGQHEGLIHLQKRSPQDATVVMRVATPFLHKAELTAETKAAYQLLGLLASGLAFDGEEVVVQLCTSTLRPLWVIRPHLPSAP